MLESICGVRFVLRERVDSTQDELRRLLESNLHAPICVLARSQTKGRGSRGNVWENERALMFSFAYNAPLILPDDVPAQSVAIFLGCVIRDILREFGSSVWLKYPNDLYIDEKKIGGILIERWRGALLCGIGVNFDSRKFGALDILLDEERFFARLFEVLQNPPSWKQIFSNYKLEFWRNYPFAFHTGDERVSLRDALLLEDGSVNVGGRVIYNLRECGV